MPSVPDWYALVQLRAGSFQNFPELDCRKAESYTCIFLPCSCNQLSFFLGKIVDSWIIPINYTDNAGFSIKGFWCFQLRIKHSRERKPRTSSEARHEARCGCVLGWAVPPLNWLDIRWSKTQCFLKGSRYQKEEHLKRLEQCGPKCSASF